MLPWLREIREAVSCHVGALPIPYRTTQEEPTFFNLSDPDAPVPSPHGRTFPTALDPLFTNRYEIRDFAREALELGVRYIGVCCGAAPIHIREVAEAAGRRPEASRYSERMQNHFMYGSNERLPEHIVGLGERA
jgi:betaine-homocysteine S-methyltransferase